MTVGAISRKHRRNGTKTIVIPGATAPSQGKQGAAQKFGLGRYSRPGKLRLTKTNAHLWKK